MNLSLIVLNFNTKDFTVACLDSIIKLYKKQLNSGEFEIIVVDNASNDNSVAAINNLRSQFCNTESSLKLIINKENYGFSKGNNIGAKNAKGKYLLFLNSDTEIQDDCLIRMVKFMEKNKKVGILGGKLIYPNKKEQKSAGKFYSFFNSVIMLLGGERFGLLRSSPSRIEKVDWVMGACMMLRKEVFEKIKGFEENIFMYVEDMDLCFKAKKHGFLTYYYPETKIIHKEFGSSNKAFAILNIYKGLLYFYKKYKSNWEYLILVFLLKLKARVVISLAILFNKRELKESYLMALKVI